MSFLKSLFLGSEGSYKVFGIPVAFKDRAPDSSSNSEGILAVTKKYLSNSVFRCATLSYAHVFCHEMGHVSMSKLFPRKNLFSSQPNAQVAEEVTIYTKTCEGVTKNGTMGLTGWKKTLVCVSGPMANIAFSTVKLVAAQALKGSIITLPIALALECGAVCEIAGELYYAYDSATKEDDGDFGMIARQGNAFLGVAGTALIAETALAASVVL